MLVDLGLIWVWILTNVLPVLSLFALIYMFYMNRKWAPTLRIAQKLIKQWAGLMNKANVEKKEFKKLTEAQKTSRSKLVQAIKGKVPFGLLDKHNDNEVIALVQDQELMKGFIFLGQTGQKFLQKIVNVVSPTTKEKKKHGIDQIPTMA